jgi:hypothetical protein
MQSLADIWNNKHYQSARSLFSDRPIADPIKTACNGCPLYKQAKHRMSTPI